MKTLQIQDKSVASEYVKTEVLSYGVMISFLDDDGDLCGHSIELNDVVSIDRKDYRVNGVNADTVILIAMATDEFCKISMKDFATYVDRF